MNYYEIKRKDDPDYWRSWIYTAKNEYNQYLRFEIYLAQGYYYNVVFYIANKRKQGFQYLKQTGKDGIKSLIWAKNCLIDFINNHPKYVELHPIKIWADDSRRMRIYKRALMPLGFKYIPNNGCYLLYKWK